MTKREFMQELEARLAPLPDYEREKSLAFYTESIDDRIEDGMEESEAVNSLGSIEEIASGILVDTPLTTLITSRIHESREKSGNKRLWLILAICGSPLWLPLAIGLAAVLFAVYVCLWAVVICLAAAAFSLGLVGSVGVLAGIVTMFWRGPVVGLALLGMGLASGGLFLMCVKPLAALCRQFIGLTTVFLRRVKRMFVKNEGAV